MPLPVLMYHSVSTVDGHLRELAVPKDRLREQLGALADAGYALVGLTEALHDNGTRAVAVTFDDGYVDFLDGLDVLREVGATATLYVCPGHIGDRMALGPLLSWDQVREVAAAGIEIGNHSLTRRSGRAANGWHRSWARRSGPSRTRTGTTAAGSARQWRGTGTTTPARSAGGCTNRVAHGSRYPGCR